MASFGKQQECLSGVEGLVVSVIVAGNPDLHDFDVLVVMEERLSVGRT